MSTSSAASSSLSHTQSLSSQPGSSQRSERQLVPVLTHGNDQRAPEHGDYALSRRLDDAGLPDPDALLRNLARSVIEIIAGIREVEQIARWVSPDVFSMVLQRAQHAKRARSLRGLAVRRPTVHARTCVWQSPRSGVVEAAIVVEIAPRVRAVAIRLEAWRGRWRAERIHVL